MINNQVLFEVLYSLLILYDWVMEAHQYYYPSHPLKLYPDNLFHLKLGDEWLIQDNGEHSRQQSQPTSINCKHLMIIILLR